MTVPEALKHILILTGEPSGDLHGSRLIQHIRQAAPEIYVSGIGGPALAEQNVDLFYSIENLSVMGFTEILMQMRKIKQAFDRFKNKLSHHLPDLIILVDYPGFNLRAAQYIKENYDIPVLYYITPKVWAWKKSRLKKIRRYVDHAALIFPFEEKIFKQKKIACTYVGNPLMDDYPETLSRPFLRKKSIQNKEDKKLVIGLLPGSRKTEIKNLAGIIVNAAQKIQTRHPDCRIIISQADAISKKFLLNTLGECKQSVDLEIHSGPVKKLIIQSDLIIAASGTVTLEAALCCVPTIIVYKVSDVSYRIARFLVTIKYAGLANLIMNQEVMPELLQYNATPEKISRTALSMIDRLPEYEDQLAGVRKRLGTPGAAKRAARIAVNMIRQL